MPVIQESKPNKLVQAIERTSSIFDILGHSPQGISIRDLSEKIKLPKGTTHRLLSSLSCFGYVRQDSKTRNYFLGLKLVELGNLLLSQLDLRNPAHSSAVSKVLLSHLTEEELNHLIRNKGLPKRTKNTITDPIQSKEHLKSVQSQGYAIDDEENERRIRWIAAPI